MRSSTSRTCPSTKGARFGANNVVRAAWAIAACAAHFFCPAPSSAQGRGPAPGPEAASIAEAVADRVTTGGITVGCMVTQPAGWYTAANGTVSFREPLPGETHHVVVTVQHAADSRVLPGCSVTVTASSGAGTSVTVPLEFAWAGAFARYMGNLALKPPADSVDLTVSVDPPRFARMPDSVESLPRDRVVVTFSDARMTSAPASIVARPAADPKRDGRGFTKGRHPAVTPTPYPGSGTAR